MNGNPHNVVSFVELLVAKGLSARVEKPLDEKELDILNRSILALKPQLEELLASVSSLSAKSRTDFERSLYEYSSYVATVASLSFFNDVDKRLGIKNAPAPARAAKSRKRLEEGHSTDHERTALFAKLRSEGKLREVFERGGPGRCLATFNAELKKMGKAEIQLRSFSRLVKQRRPIE